MPDKNLIPLDDILMEDRAREEYTEIEKLATSLDELGQIQPIIIDEKNRILVGGRRFAAAIMLGWPKIWAVKFSTLSPLQRLKVELHENTEREDFTWQEEVALKKKVSELERASANPKNRDEIAEEMGVSKSRLSSDLTLADAAERYEEIASAPDKKTARTRLRRIQDTDRRMAVVSRTEVKDEVYLADALDILPTIADESISLVLFDPPYGTDLQDAAPRAGFDKWLKAWPSMFQDDLVSAAYATEECLANFKRVMKPGAHGYIFCGIAAEIKYNEGFISKLLSRSGLSFQRMPLFWFKNTCSNPDPYRRFGINYECLFFFWKDGTARDLEKPHMALFEHRVNTQTKKHPTEKPVELYRELIELSTKFGETVLDPMAGSGNALVAAKELGRKIIGIEKLEEYHSIMIENLDKIKEEEG